MAAIASVLPALTQITSSIASTANYGVTRMRSFTGSFNDRTRLLLAPAPAAPPEQEPTSPSAADEARAPGTFDIEAATPATLDEGGGGGGQGHHEPATQDDAESKRVAKSVHTVCLFVASASLVLFVNLPGTDDVPSASASKPGGAAAAAAGGHGRGGALYSAGLAFISLGFFSSLGLSMLSIVARPGEAAVAGVQKWGMIVAVASVLVAFTLRMCMVLPAASL